MFFQLRVVATLTLHTAAPLGEVAHLGVAAEVADDDDLVDRCHVGLLVAGPFDADDPMAIIIATGTGGAIAPTGALGAGPLAVAPIHGIGQ